MRELDIGEVVKRSGVPASTLRYYEQLGLLQALGRRGLRRQYDAQVLERLALIGLGQAAGLSLQQIGASLPSQQGCISLDREALLAQAEVLQRQITRLQRVRRHLQRAAACPEAQDARQCGSFRKLLRAQQRMTGG
ncbi:MerR family transcriptional regulator [Stenotrophomonas maltophilia group sp. P373]|uniref:MerR family transcriptional regulator n=1 Tax=Stenotrophomonas TaxID=40323 RepID=UPI000DA9C70F|nr:MULTISPECIES: MerR family transcriptional regulator [Stenotrophomonas]AYA91058.1 MerR family transcriptional regulator [Stenotrophomonas sp. Pemsol]MCU1006251.1 MerR family transcriptional regulator [Stenotrophomonas maltophilia]PZS93172.1 MerR family transcriptional regulator [Stenotrophomonas maltophilia]PZT20053.1 MerR family transcriptional regulator [Stenotrophomonas maltophilia]PZT41061.1 MerR family transcriptional regulator [Stenotrophomonas maltophilia]